MKLVTVPAVFLAFAALAQAQGDYPKAEVFGGYSVLSIGDLDSSREALHGWQASVSGNVSRSVGIVGDFGGHYKKFGTERLKTFEYLFGPRFTLRREKANVFGHVMAGGVRASVAGESENAFAMGIGGGVDVRVNNRVSVRIIQIDWVPNRFDGEWSKGEVRFGFGLVFGGGGS